MPKLCISYGNTKFVQARLLQGMNLIQRGLNGYEKLTNLLIEGKEQFRFMEGSPHYLEFLTASHYLQGVLKSNSKILDTCAGTGAYALMLARQGHMVTAGDIVPYNVELMKQA